MPSIRLADLAEQLDAELHGDLNYYLYGDDTIDYVASIFDDFSPEIHDELLKYMYGLLG